MIRDDQLLISGDPEHSQALAKVFDQHWQKPEPPAAKVEAEPRTFYVNGKLLTKTEWEARKRKLRND